MRNTIIGLLISLLVLLVYIASCGPNQVEKTAQSATDSQANVDVAVPATAAATEQQSLTSPAAKPVVTPTKPAAVNNVQRAQAALRAAGFRGVSVQEVDGSLLLRGNVNSPADRVRAGRSLASLGMPVINHVRAKQATTAKPLAVVMEKSNGTVSLRGDMTAAMHQSLKQRFSLVGSSAVNEVTVSTPNASGVVQLAASAIDRLNSGSVRITDTRVVVEGESSGDAQAFRMGLNRGLPRGFSLTTDVRSAAIAQRQSETVTSALPIATTVPVAVAESVVVNTMPHQSMGSGRYQAAASSNSQTDYPLAKTYPLEPGDVGYRAAGSSVSSVATYPPAGISSSQGADSTVYRSEVRYAAPEPAYPIAETFPLESAGTAYRSESRYEGSVSSVSYDRDVYAEPSAPPVAYAEPVAQPFIERSVFADSVADTGSIDGNCHNADLNLMPQGSIRFFHNSAQLTHKARQRMELATAALRRCPQLDVEVSGHTDVTGADFTNGDISRARAERIALYLRNHGVSAERIRVASYGDSQPAFSNDSKFGRAMNRRVELHVRR